MNLKREMMIDGGIVGIKVIFLCITAYFMEREQKMIIYRIFIIEKALLNAKNQLESIRWSNSLLFYHISLYQIVFNLYTIIVHLINAYQRQYQLFNISPPIHKKSHISLSFFPIPILSRFFPHRTYRMNPVQSIL